jgi:hypothetical protein
VSRVDRKLLVCVLSPSFSILSLTPLYQSNVSDLSFSTHLGPLVAASKITLAIRCGTRTCLSKGGILPLACSTNSSFVQQVPNVQLHDPLIPSSDTTSRSFDLLRNTNSCFCFWGALVLLRAPRFGYFGTISSPCQTTGPPSPLISWAPFGPHLGTTWAHLGTTWAPEQTCNIKLCLRLRIPYNCKTTLG